MAIDTTKAVVSLKEAKTYLGIADTDTADDLLLDMLIGQASVLIAKELGYNPISQSYKEWYEGEDGFNIWLENIPVTSVDFISTDREDVATVKYDSTDASYATVEVTANQLKLRKRVNGAVTANTLVLSDYATIALLDTAIDALTPWACTPVDSFSTWAASSLIRMPAQHANNVSASLSVPADPEADVELFPETGRLYNWRGWRYGKWDWLHGGSGRVGLGDNVRNVYVEYTAGYTRAELPEPIKAACLELVALTFNLSKKDGSLASETIGDYSYSLATTMGSVFGSTGSNTTGGMIAMKLAPYVRAILRTA